MSYFVYIVQCADTSLYTGIAKDIDKRIQEHNNSPKGAKYTLSRRPVVLKYQETFETRSLALKREAQIKKLRREKNLLLSQIIYDRRSPPTN